MGGATGDWSALAAPSLKVLSSLSLGSRTAGQTGLGEQWTVWPLT